MKVKTNYIFKKLMYVGLGPNKHCKRKIVSMCILQFVLFKLVCTEYQLAFDNNCQAWQ